MTAFLDIATDALQELGVLGVGQVANADDASTCLIAMNALIGSWNLAPLVVYSNQQTQVALPAATASLTIGPAQAINVTRPVEISSGCFVRVGNLDYPLDSVGQTEYNEITLKTLSGPWPRICMYDRGFPTGNLFFYPLGACTVNLNLQVQLSQFALVTDTVSLPPGYQRMFALALAEEVAAKFGAPLRPDTVRKSQSAQRVVKRQNLIVPQLQVGAPPTLPGRYAILGG